VDQHAGEELERVHRLVARRTAIKVASFGSAVNVTLGLPFPRTSPDHGTALDIAGQGIADSSSFRQAVLLCAQLAHHCS